MRRRWCCWSLPPALVLALIIAACAPNDVPSVVDDVAPGGATPAAGEILATPSGQRVEVISDNSDALILVAWAFSRFVAAGIPEPVISTVTFDGDLERCGESGVLAWTVLAEPSDVSVCPEVAEMCRRVNGVVLTRAGRLCILHEFSHAWMAQNLSEQEREAFMALVGVEAWNDEDSLWIERGIEQAAETMAFSLMDEDFDVLMPGVPKCDVRREAFQELTGVPPLAECSAADR